ncbi:MAG: DUF58 domain-containing protein [Anaerolineales bacterium]|nr:DUF58 domain-containing protein [Anaerolineales bacterium]
MLARRLVVFGLLLLCAIGALVTGRQLFYNLVYLWLTIIVIAGVWTWTAINRLRLGRHTRALRAQVGRPLEERLSVRNTSPVPKLWLEVRDHSDLPGHEASLVVDSLGPNRERVWVVRTLCRERGRFRLGPLSLTSGDPFGLFQVTRPVPQTTHIVVYPMTVDLPDFTLPLGPMPGGDALRRRTHYVTANASGVRDYAPGDSFNRIHWASTARRDRLIVKEFELDPLSDIWLFLDGDRSVQAALSPVEPEPGPLNALWPNKPERVTLPPSTEEYAVSVTASLAQYFVRHDRTVGLLTYGRTREVVQPDRGERQLTKMLETLAMFRAESRIPLDDALSLEAQQLPRWTTLIIVTSSGDMQWVLSAQALKRHGLRVIAIVVDAATFGGYNANAGTVEALWSAGIPAFRVNYGDDLVQALSYGSFATQRLGGAVVA